MGQQPSKERARLQVVKDEMDKASNLLNRTHDTWVVDYHLQLFNERRGILACLGVCPTCAQRCCGRAPVVQRQRPGWLGGACFQWQRPGWLVVPAFSISALAGWVVPAFSISRPSWLHVPLPS